MGSPFGDNRRGGGGGGRGGFGNRNFRGRGRGNQQNRNFNGPNRHFDGNRDRDFPRRNNFQQQDGQGRRNNFTKFRDNASIEEKSVPIGSDEKFYEDKLGQRNHPDSENRQGSGLQPNWTNNFQSKSAESEQFIPPLMHWNVPQQRSGDKEEAPKNVPEPKEPEIAPPAVKIKKEKPQTEKKKPTDVGKKNDPESSSDSSSSSSDSEPEEKKKKTVNGKAATRPNIKIKKEPMEKKKPAPPSPAESTSSTASSDSDSSSSDEESSNERHKKSKSQSKSKKSPKGRTSEEDVVCLGKLEKFENLVDDDDAPSKGGPCLLCDKQGHSSFNCQMICKNCGAQYHNLKSCPRPPNLSVMLQSFMEFCMTQCYQYNPEARFQLKNGGVQTEMLPSAAPFSESVQDTESVRAHKRQRTKSADFKVSRRKQVQSSESDSASSSSEATSSTKRKKKQRAGTFTSPNMSYTSPFAPPGMPFFNAQGVPFNPMMAYSQMMGFNPAMNFAAKIGKEK